MRIFFVSATVRQLSAFIRGRQLPFCRFLPRWNMLWRSGV